MIVYVSSIIELGATPNSSGMVKISLRRCMMASCWVSHLLQNKSKETHGNKYVSGKITMKGNPKKIKKIDESILSLYLLVFIIF